MSVVAPATESKDRPERRMRSSPSRRIVLIAPSVQSRGTDTLPVRPERRMRSIQSRRIVMSVGRKASRVEGP